MQNLVINQNGIYTYRKFVHGISLRVSLKTKDKSEAIRIVSGIESILDIAKSNDPYTTKSLIYAALNKFQPMFAEERLAKVQSLLDITIRQDNGELLSTVIKLFIEEKLRTNSWTEKTYVTYKAIYESLNHLITDKPIDLVTYKDAQNVKATLQKLPSSINKRACYRGKTIKQLLKIDVPQSHLMSVKTINTRLSCFSELFKWGIKNGYCKVNVFDGSQLKDNRNTRELRLPFTPEDLNRIFKSEKITSPVKPWQRWIPLLALYTGARLNELCQLQRKDIKCVDGIWCIFITDKGENQHLKSISSRRVIPLHTEIIKVGFLEYISSFDDCSTQRVFPELPMRDKRFAHTPSKWFGNLKNKLLNEPEKKSFHSFRHTFIDYLYNALKLQGNPLVKVLVGHSDKEVTSGVYGSAFEVLDLNQVIQKIEFDINYNP